MKERKVETIAQWQRPRSRAGPECPGGPGDQVTETHNGDLQRTVRERGTLHCTLYLYVEMKVLRFMSIRKAYGGIKYLDWAIGSHISNNYSVPVSHISILYYHYISIIVHLFALARSNSVKNDLGMFVLSPFRAALLDCLRAFTQPSLKTNPGPRFQLC